MIVIMGITVIPTLYAWFNIAASWDPYGNTGNLKVAVASVDKGYEGSLIPLELNMGDQVLTSLRSNSQLDWYYQQEKSSIRSKIRKILCGDRDTGKLQYRYDESVL